METSSRYFPCDIPPGKSGPWVVERVTIPERAYDPDRDPRPDCFKFRPGIYTSLRCGSIQFMTDLYDEWWTQRQAMDEARRRGGRVLITGLGLGLVAQAILRDPDSAVERVTILEQSPDVIRLVAPSLAARHPGKVEVVEADAFTWSPGDARFSVVWHDIWPDPYLPQIEAERASLEARYLACSDWRGYWPQEYLRALRGG
jgi:hypothetical protein